VVHYRSPRTSHEVHGCKDVQPIIEDEATAVQVVNCRLAIPEHLQLPNPSQLEVQCPDVATAGHAARTRLVHDNHHLQNAAIAYLRILPLKRIRLQLLAPVHQPLLRGRNAETGGDLLLHLGQRHLAPELQGAALPVEQHDLDGARGGHHADSGLLLHLLNLIKIVEDGADDAVQQVCDHVHVAHSGHGVTLRAIVPDPEQTRRHVVLEALQTPRWQMVAILGGAVRRELVVQLRFATLLALHGARAIRSEDGIHHSAPMVQGRQAKALGGWQTSRPRKRSN